MCRFLAYSGAPIMLDSLLVEPRSSLIAQSLAAREAKTVVNADGCGIGWYGERPEPGVYRGVLPAWSDMNLASLCRTIRTSRFVAHVRSATSGEVALANCHPFVHGRHLFMHNGQVGDYDRVRRRIDGLIPDAFFPYRRGTSDSEAIFLVAMGLGLDRDPVGAVTRALAAVRCAMREGGAERAFRLAAVHVDGETVRAYRWASDGHPPKIYWRQLDQGIVLASEPFDDDPAPWTVVPSGSMLTITPGHAVETVALDLPN